MTKPALTICSVSHYSWEYLEWNRELVARLNGNDGWVWIVVDNTPLAAVNRLEWDAEGNMVLEGVPADPTKPGVHAGSYQHAAALNKALGYIQTRFALILDPDFYIVRRRWIKGVLGHMLNNNLGFFGVPWHPKWFVKYRYFPCVHCMFIDLEKVSLRHLDFTPEFDRVVERPRHPFAARWEGLERRLPALGRRLLQPLLALVKDRWQQVASERQFIGASADTGYKLSRQYGQSHQVRFEYAAPVFQLRADFLGPARVLTWQGRIAEWFLPDSVSYLPKRPGYYTHASFCGGVYPQASGIGFEEFRWQGKPFGLHVRRHMQDERNLQRGQTLLPQILQDVAAHAWWLA